MRFIIDGSDGYVCTVETGMDTRAGVAAKIGSIIEVSPPSLRKVDRNIQAIALDLKQGRASDVKLLSVQDLNAQLTSPSATWLDRSLVSWGKGGIQDISSRSSVFAKELDAAFSQRRAWLIERGYAELSQETQKTLITYKRGYVKALEAEGFNVATQKLEGMTGKTHVVEPTGRLIEGTVAQKF